MTKLKVLLNKKGFTYIEALCVLFITMLLLPTVLDYFFLQQKVISECIMLSEYKRQIFMAETNIKRDLFEAANVEIISHNRLLIKDISGNEILYYLAADPYSHENLIKKESRTLYRKKNQQNAMPLTQYLKAIEFFIDDRGQYKKIIVEIDTEKINSKTEVYYDKNSFR